MSYPPDDYQPVNDSRRIEQPEVYELKLCPTCNQMTNHLMGLCQKCLVSDEDRQPLPSKASSKEHAQLNTNYTRTEHVSSVEQRIDEVLLAFHSFIVSGYDASGVTQPVYDRHLSKQQLLSLIAEERLDEVEIFRCDWSGLEWKQKRVAELKAQIKGEGRYNHE